MCSICSESRQDRPLEALEVGDEAAVAEIANVLVALFDLSDSMLEVDLFLQIPNLKPAGRSRDEAAMLGPTAGVGRKKKTPRVRQGVFSSQRRSIAAHLPSASLAQRELAV